VKRGKIHEIVASHEGDRVTGVSSMFEACGSAVAVAPPEGEQGDRKGLQTARARRRGDLRD
jgi:hypothetical protein